MNFLFLPDKVRKQLGSIFSKALPIAVLRLNRCLDGSNGEGFVIAGPENVFIFSRKVGQAAYSMFETSLDKINNLKIAKGSLDSFIEFESEGKKISLSFAPFEEKYVKPMIEKWQGLESKIKQVAEMHPEQVQSPTQKESTETVETKVSEIASKPAEYTAVIDNDGNLSPAGIFSAALMFIAGSDNKIAEAESYFINKKFSADKTSLQQGMYFYDNHTYEELLKFLPSLTKPQKLCILANMIELSMVEDVFGSVQQDMLWNFASSSGIKEKEYFILRDTFITKNRTSVLYDNNGVKKT